MRRSFWITRVNFKLNDKQPYKRKVEADIAGKKKKTDKRGEGNVKMKAEGWYSHHLKRMMATKP